MDIRWDVIKSFAIRTGLSGAVAAVAYAVGHVVDLGASGTNAALITFGITYVGHFIHALSVKYGVDDSALPPDA